MMAVGSLAKPGRTFFSETKCSETSGCCWANCAYVVIVVELPISVARTFLNGACLRRPMGDSVRNVEQL